MNILIFNTFYYPKLIGGAEVSVQLLAEGLAASGNKVFVVTFGKENFVSSLNGVRVIRIKQRNIYSSYDEGKKHGLLKLIWHLIDSCNLPSYYLVRSLLNRIKPDIVHTNNIQGFSPLIWRAVKRKGIPLVHTFRDYYLLCHRNNQYHNGRKCEKLCLSCKVTHSIKKTFAGYPDCYVGLSDFVLKRHGQYLPLRRKQTEIIYNSVVRPAGIPIEKKPNGKVVIGFMGRITQDKGVGYLAGELVKVRQELKSKLKVIFAGKGDMEYVRQLQQTLQGIEFEFPGMMKPAGFYEKVDVAVTPSLWDEPFGRVVIESLSYSVPVILATSGGLNELHNPDCTWSFFPTENKLHPLIEYIVENKQEIVLKKKYCSEYASLFSSSDMIQKYQSLYHKLI